MSHRTALHPSPSALVLLTGLIAGGCSSSGSDLATEGFQLTLISVPEGETSWQINRPVEFEFNEPVEFDSVNLNTIQIRRSDGTPATGDFTIKQVRNPVTGELVTLENVVIFQPTCPRLPDFADAGFQPGGVEYEIRVVGLDTGDTITLQSGSGRALNTGQVRRFQTPESIDPAKIFQDTAVGPPQPLVRGAAGVAADEELASYLELGGEGGERVYFQFDNVDNSTPEAEDETFQQFLTIDDVPLNLYSLESSKVAVVVAINQPVDPAPENITAERIGIEFLDTNGLWQPVAVAVDLVSNCTEAGAELRLEPVGILPPTTDLRVVIEPEFQDIRGDFNLLPVNEFAVMRTESLAGNEGADEVLEEFLVGGEVFNSFEDIDTVFPGQRADWGEGRLSAAFGFDGTGGPGGDFDFLLSADQTLQFDTVSQAIANEQNSATQIVSGGVIHVRNFTVEPGAEVRFSGPNPVKIFATGDVTIRGTVDISGFAANNVQSLNLATVPQAGGLGTGGGGAGGIGSPLSSSSSPRGGPGEGAFAIKGLGGVGGESGFAAPSDRNNWRPGGGGAGVFGPDEYASPEEEEEGPDDQNPENGLIAQPGFDGFDSTNPGFLDFTPVPTGAFGAETGLIPAAGGPVGPSPFLDSDDENNFWGVMLQAGFNQCDVAKLGAGPVIGELPTPWAGSGGGGGGDAIHGDEFPSPQFLNPETSLTSNDYKGGAGGGGGGGIHILALGTIRFEGAGQIISNGGVGGTGESTFFIDRVGGGGGGGSGGHVILESDTGVEFNGITSTAVVQAKGGRGGLGLPLGENPEGTNEFNLIHDVLMRRINEGGTGGPGVVQIHVPGATPSQQLANILVDGLQADCDSALTVSDLTQPDAVILVPSFGAVSRAQSEWISLGGASPASGATNTPASFLFGGTDGESFDEDAEPGEELDIGFVQTVGNDVLDLDPILTGTVTSVEGDKVVVPSTGISDTIYIRNPALLIGFEVVLERNGVERRFDVVGAGYDGDLTLTLTGNSVGDFGSGDGIEIVPRFFRVVTNVGGEDELDVLPTTQSVQVLFQATGRAPDGSPNSETILVPSVGDPNAWTGNIEDLNVDLEDPVAFFRFTVIFDTGGVSASTPLPSLEFLRMPFKFTGPTADPE